MICPKCQTENPDEKKFCRKCGAELLLTCPRCEAEVLSDDIFCGECGYELTGPAPVEPAASPSAPARIPTSFADGRYEVKEFLGEGGKKKVYRAYDTLLDRDVALALIKTEGLDEDSRTRITREAQAMGRLGAHNNIVTVFDLGDHEGQPYIVQELMAGSDVEKLIQEAPDHRLCIDQTIEIAQSVCAGLEFAHNKGVIHRDIKPSNIWLTEEGTVKIGDFGLAMVDDRTRLTREGMTLGTVSYMPPEQAIGTDVIPQSDLYSLGAMLYEMVTGRPPFIGDDTVAIIGQHLNTPPVSPSWHNPEIPPVLEGLILKLLEKSTANRSASALEVNRALDSIQKGAMEKEPDKGDTRSEKSGPLYHQVFVGRENELKQLKTAFDHALSGAGSLIMVVGEPGIGKTAVTEQLATYAAMRGGLVLVGHCYEEGSLSLPYLAFVEAMRTYVLGRETNELRQAMGTGASEVARILSEVRDKLNVEPRPPVNPDEDRYRLFQAVTDFLFNASTVQPLLIVLEDLHDADRGTLDLLVHISRRLSGNRLLIVGTYRDVEVERGHSLSSALAELRRVSTYERVLLRGLTIDEVQRMLTGLSGQEVTWQIAEAVHRQTEGNPLFVQEVLRYAVEDGLIVRESGEWRAVNPDQLIMSIPEGLRDVIGKRLSSLSLECNQVLSVASVIGREFRFEMLQKVAHVTEDFLYSAIEEARTTAVIEERTSIGVMVTYRFTHAFFRQTLYEEMIAPRRNSLHQQVAKALEKLFSDRLSDHAAELFEHFSHSTHPDDLTKAVQYGEMAAKRATAVFDYGEAVRLLEQTLQVQEILDPEDKKKRCDLLITLCNILITVGEIQRILDKDAPEALLLAESINDKERASQICSLSLFAIFSTGAASLTNPEATRWAERADKYAKPETRERALADMSLGMVRTKGRFFLFDKALDLSRRLDDPETIWLLSIPWLFFTTAPHNAKKRLEFVEELIQKFRNGVSIHRYGNALIYIISTFLELGFRERMEEIATEARYISERISQPNLLSAVLFCDALLAYFEGRLEEAVEIGGRIRRIGEDLNITGHYIFNASAHFCTMRPLIFLGKGRSAFPNDPNTLESISLRVFYLAYLGMKAEAINILNKIIQTRIRIDPLEDESHIYGDMLILEAAVHVGHRQTAEMLLRRYKGTIVYTTGMYCITCINRHLGAAATMLGRMDEAKNHYHDALDVTTNMRFRPELALSRFQLAELQLEHFLDEKTEAIEHLNFAINEFKEMKMQPSLEKALELRDKIRIGPSQ